MQGYQSEVNAYTKGMGRLSCTLKGYEPCHDTDQVIAAFGYYPDADVENPSSSVFCAHGAGFLVTWDQVAAYAHVESGWSPETENGEEEDLFSGEGGAAAGEGTGRGLHEEDRTREGGTREDRAREDRSGEIAPAMPLAARRLLRAEEERFPTERSPPPTISPRKRLKRYLRALTEKARGIIRHTDITGCGSRNGIMAKLPRQSSRKRKRQERLPVPLGARRERRNICW